MVTSVLFHCNLTIIQVVFFRAPPLHPHNFNRYKIKPKTMRYGRVRSSVGLRVNQASPGQKKPGGPSLAKKKLEPICPAHPFVVDTGRSKQTRANPFELTRYLAFKWFAN